MEPIVVAIWGLVIATALLVFNSWWSGRQQGEQHQQQLEVLKRHAVAFEDIKEVLAKRYEAAEPAAAPVAEGQGYANAGAMIRATENLEQLAGVLVNLSRPESPAERAARLREDRAHDAKRKRMGRSLEETGAR